MKNNKGEIATFLTFAALIVIGVTTFVSSAFLKSNKIATNPRAQGACCGYDDLGNCVCFLPSSDPVPQPEIPPAALDPIVPDPGITMQDPTIVPGAPLPAAAQTTTYEEWVNCYQGGGGEACGPQPPVTTPEPEPPCFLAGTKVLMADGHNKEIEAIKNNDEVASYDFVNKKLVNKKVVVSVNHVDYSGGYFLINNLLKVTGNHPLWVNNKKWTKADEVKIGDILLSSNKQSIIVHSVNYVRGVYTVYNLSIEGPYHNYFAENILVHNKPKFAPPRISPVPVPTIIKDADYKTALQTWLDCSKTRTDCGQKPIAKVDFPNWVIDPDDPDKARNLTYSGQPAAYDYCMSNGGNRSNPNHTCSLGPDYEVYTDGTNFYIGGIPKVVPASPAPVAPVVPQPVVPNAPVVAPLPAISQQDYNQQMATYRSCVKQGDSGCVKPLSPIAAQPAVPAAAVAPVTTTTGNKGDFSLFEMLIKSNVSQEKLIDLHKIIIGGPSKFNNQLDNIDPGQKFGCNQDKTGNLICAPVNKIEDVPKYAIICDKYSNVITDCGPGGEVLDVVYGMIPGNNTQMTKTTAQPKTGNPAGGQQAPVNPVNNNNVQRITYKFSVPGKISIKETDVYPIDPLALEYCDRAQTSNGGCTNPHDQVVGNGWVTMSFPEGKPLIFCGNIPKDIRPQFNNSDRTCKAIVQ